MWTRNVFEGTRDDRLMISRTLQVLVVTKLDGLVMERVERGPACRLLGVT